MRSLLTRTLWGVWVASVACGGSAVLAEETPARAPALSIESLRVKADELPAGVSIVDGLHAVSSQASSWYAAPHPSDMSSVANNEQIPKQLLESIPRPKQKSQQSFLAKGGVPGTVFVFEYETADHRTLIAFLNGYLWGPPRKGEGHGQRSATHPEELIVRERFVIVLSFPMGDPAAEWFKDRLRRVFRIPAPRFRRDLVPMFRRLREAISAGDNDGGLKILDENSAAASESSFAQYLRGELGIGKRDWKTAEAGYRTAIELDDRIVDPLGESVRWACLDGRGSALLRLGRLDDAAKVLESAWEFARAQGRDLKASSTSVYNLSCALALAGKFEASASALRQAIEADADWREKAKKDPDLVEALKSPRFQEILK